MRRDGICDAPYPHILVSVCARDRLYTVLRPGTALPRRQRQEDENTYVTRYYELFSCRIYLLKFNVIEVAKIFNACTEPIGLCLVAGSQTYHWVLF